MNSYNLDYLDSNYSTLDLDEMYDINGGFITLTIAGVAYVITAKAAAGIVAGAYGIGYVLGKGWAHRK